MVSRLDGKAAIVTGAAGGIGAAIAARLAEAGARLALIDRTAPAAPPAGAMTLVADLGKPEAVDEAFARAVDGLGAIDILVNVAGIMIFKPVEDQTAEDWHRLLSVNLVAPALLTGHALRRMPPGGAIVNVASVHARRTTALVSSYAASKAALVSLTRSTAIEGRARGIRCNAVLPGAIDTPLLHESPAIKSGAEVLDPADVGDPRDVAEAVLFLVSDAARFVTGEDVVVDNGRMARL